MKDTLSEIITDAVIWIAQHWEFIWAFPVAFFSAFGLLPMDAKRAKSDSEAQAATARLYVFYATLAIVISSGTVFII